MFFKWNFRQKEPPKSYFNFCLSLKLLSLCRYYNTHTPSYWHDFSINCLPLDHMQSRFICSPRALQYIIELLSSHNWQIVLLYIWKNMFLLFICYVWMNLAFGTLQFWSLLGKNVFLQQDCPSSVSCTDLCLNRLNNMKIPQYIPTIDISNN